LKDKLRVDLTLNKELYEKLEEVSKKTGHTKSWILRKALEEYFSKGKYVELKVSEEE